MRRNGASRVAFEIRNLAFQLAGHPDIVSIQERYQPTVGVLEPGVSRGARPSVRLMQDAKPITPFCNPRERLISGAIVHDNHVVIGKGLCEDRFQRGRNGPTRVIRGYDDAHQWHDSSD